MIAFWKYESIFIFKKWTGKEDARAKGVNLLCVQHCKNIVGVAGVRKLLEKMFVKNKDTGIQSQNVF